MADTGDFGEYGQNPFDFMSPQDMVAAVLGSNAVINGGAPPVNSDSQMTGGKPLNPALSSPTRGMVPDAAMSRPAISTGARPMLDMGAPVAPSISAPAPVAPIQPVLRTAAQPNIPMPGAPAIDPQRAQLEQQTATLRQPLDRNASQFRPHWYDYLKAAALGALGGVAHRPDLSAAAGERAVQGKYIDANTKRLQQLGAAEQDISAIDKTQQEKDKQFSQEMDIYKGAIGQRREDRAEESQSRRDAADEQRNANEDRRLTTVEKSQAEREKQDSAREAETIRHNKADEALKQQSNDTADRNATTRETTEKDRAARYKGVSDSNKKAVDKVYSDRDRRLDSLERQHSKETQAFSAYGNGPTMQKMKAASDAEYQKQLDSIHASAKQRITQLGGSYDSSLDGNSPNSGGKYKIGDQIPDGQYKGRYVKAIDAKGNYTLSRTKP
jgi:hypothetical protein